MAVWIQPVYDLSLIHISSGKKTECKEIIAVIDNILLGLGFTRTMKNPVSMDDAMIATEAGCEMVIANGWNPDLLYGIVEGEPIGTRFLAKKVSK